MIITPLQTASKATLNFNSYKEAYLETFDEGAAGWWSWDGNDKGFKKLETGAGTITSRSPWWIDYNHAPPGAGYIHMVFCLNTKGPFGEQIKEAAGPNGFTMHPRKLDFTNAEMTIRIRGEVIANGAELVLLLQGTGGGTCTGWMLTEQPFRITSTWTEQTIKLTPDESQWTCLGARHDRTDYYGHAPLAKVLGNVDINLMLVMFPLTVAPMGSLDGNPHILRAERDYPVWRSKLPEGYVTLDTVQFKFLP